MHRTANISSKGWWKACGSDGRHVDIFLDGCLLMARFFVLTISKCLSHPRLYFLWHGMPPGGLHTVVSSDRGSMSSPEVLHPVSCLGLAVPIHGNQGKMVAVTMLVIRMWQPPLPWTLSRTDMSWICYILCGTALHGNLPLSSFL